ncbi:hypothetical protein LCGC14_2854520 [marine sediment metagenome]|uniref:KOW domain-containing protein n=1 Tax=marine sediment metagenome TaxID=412755 RepID=A0A0F8Y7F3_9ZZZZ
MKNGDKVLVIKTKYKGETGVIVGKSDLDMEAVYFVKRDKKNVKVNPMWFEARFLAKQHN